MKNIILILTMLISFNLHAEDIWDISFVRQNPALLFEMQTFGNKVLIVGTHGSALISDNQGDTWKELYVGTEGYLTRASFCNENEVYICGEYGIIIRYRLNDNTFEDCSFNPKNQLSAIKSINENVVMVGSKDGHLFRSMDKGKQWDTVFNLKGAEVKSIEMMNENTGFAAFSVKNYETKENKSYVAKTTNSGLTWDLIAEFQDENIQKLQIINGEIWINGKFGLLVKSVDEGKSWQWFKRKLEEPIWSLIKVNSEMYIATGWNSHGVMKSYNLNKEWRLSLPAGDQTIFNLAQTKDYIYALDFKKNCAYIYRKKI